MSVETSMRQEKWRVRSLGPHAWGIYPPGWDLDGRPLLMFVSQVQAIRAASKRADFSATPPVAQEDWETLGLMADDAMLPNEGIE